MCFNAMILERSVSPPCHIIFAVQVAHGADKETTIFFSPVQECLASHRETKALAELVYGEWVVTLQTLFVVRNTTQV